MHKTTAPDFHKKSLLIKQDDHKFFLSKLVSKESSTANPSFRVYYGDASGAVPFTWETRPGTPKPKHTWSCSADEYSTLPPLTPPPSYSYYNSVGTANKEKRPTSKLVRNLLRRMNLNDKPHLATSLSPSSSLSSLSWSSSYNVSYSGASRRRRGRFPSWGSSSFDEVGDHQDHLQMPIHGSRFCFPVKRNQNQNQNQRSGINQGISVKKNLFSRFACSGGGSG